MREEFQKLWVKEFVKKVGMAGNEYFLSPSSVAQRNRKEAGWVIYQAAIESRQREIDGLIESNKYFGDKVLALQQELADTKRQKDELREKFEQFKKDTANTHGLILDELADTKKKLEHFKESRKKWMTEAFVVGDELEAFKKEALEVIGFYGDPEMWMTKYKDTWTQSSPKTHGDDELIRNYGHPETDWIGSVNVGGKRARSFLQKHTTNK